VSIFEVLKELVVRVYVKSEQFSIQGEGDSFITGAMVEELIQAAVEGMQDGKYSQASTLPAIFNYTIRLHPNAIHFLTLLLPFGLQ